MEWAVKEQPLNKFVHSAVLERKGANDMCLNHCLHFSRNRNTTAFSLYCAIIYKMFVSYLIKSKFIVFPLKAHATHRVVSGTGQTREQGNNTQTCILEGGGARLAP